MPEKTCFKCGATKPLDDFYRHPMMRDGHLNKCKECTKVDSSMRDPAKVRAYDRARAKRPARIAKLLEGQRRRRSLYPERVRAHRRVAWAVKTGKLARPRNCSMCFRECRVVSHHEDYSKPLDVVWVCEDCHKRIHAVKSQQTVPF